MQPGQLGRWVRCWVPVVAGAVCGLLLSAVVGAAGVWLLLKI
jgi:uncharacterized membrane protein YoaK (UPF0700 family)